jgi:nicotinate-nucleotide--dimethylbenzimidazole phosphoribosyltransferase
MTPSARQTIADLTAGIAPPSEPHRALARQRLDTLTKPLGSLGRLEDLAAQVVAIRADLFDTSAPTRAAYIFAADHGITAEGVSAYPRAVTHQMVLNFLAHGAAINVLSKLHHVALHVVDMGVDADLPDSPLLLRHKIAPGTRNMLHEPAMSDAQLAQALQVGADLAAQAAAAGHTFLAIGEMGIGNTTSASAIASALTGSPAELVTGRGTGLDPAARAHKVAIVEQILARHHLSPTQPLDILRTVGGLEIAAMTGMVLGAARHRLVLVVDGFIATAAAALAVALEPLAQGFLVAGHRSQEPGHAVLLDHLNLTPILSLDLRLGEGSGAVLALPILDSAIALYTHMATFTSAGVSEATE